MSEKKCPKCSKDIPAEAVICKFCGANFKKKNWFKRHPVWSVLIVLIGIPFLIGEISYISDLASPKTEVKNGATVASTSQPIDQKVIFPVDFTSSSVTTDSVGYPVFNVTIKNKSKKTIDAIEVTAKFTNNFGDLVGEYGQASQTLFKGSSQDKVAPGASSNSSWSIIGYSGATKVTELEVYRVHFTDGETLQAN